MGSHIAGGTCCKYIIPAVFLLLLLSPAYAVLEHGTLKIFAVTENGDGLSADLILDIEPGTGKVWSALTSLIGTTTQNTERISVALARNYVSNVDKYDYKFEISSNASLVEGPSAGAAMALLTISMLQNKTIPPTVGITGTITTEGMVGNVGGIFEKAKEAASIGTKLLMIPDGEASQIIIDNEGVQSINLMDYALENWGMKVVEVTDIDEVLSYAFTDIETIDVGKVKEQAFVEFVPTKLETGEQLAPMQEILEEYIATTEADVKSAKNALSGTLLSDGEWIDILLDILASSEDGLKNAKILFRQNYLYSAANLAFLASIDAALVKDISDNPSLLDESSTVFDLKLQALDKEIKNLKADLDRFVSIDYLEWHIAAKQRLTYAELNVNKLRTEKTVILGGDRSTQVELTYKRLYDYESAVGWYKIAMQFFEKTQASEKLVYSDDEFKGNLDQFIVNIENGISVLPDEREDIERRLSAAKDEETRGWYLAALFDAATTLSFINAELAVQNQTTGELYDMLVNKIEAVESTINETGRQFVWARLYLDHAKYFKNAVDFYLERNQGLRALDSARGGISLVYLAEGLVPVANEMYGYYDTFDEGDYVIEIPYSAPPAGGINFNDPVVLGLSTAIIIAVLLILLLLINTMHRVSGRSGPLPAQIENIRKIESNLEKSLLKKKISEDEYRKLRDQYDEQIAGLARKHAEKSRHVIEMTDMKSKLPAFQHSLRGLEHNYKRGLVTRDDYLKHKNFLNHTIVYLSAEIKREGALLKPEKKKKLSAKIPDKTSAKSTGKTPPKIPEKKPFEKTNKGKKPEKTNTKK